MSPWRKTCPTPLHKRGLDCQGSSNFPLHSLSLHVSIAPCCAHILGSFWPQPLVLRLTRNIPDTFSIWRARKKLTMGECRVKKFSCKLGALQRAFREPAILRQGRDALMPKNHCGHWLPPLCISHGGSYFCSNYINMTFSATYYLELHNATSIYFESHILPTNDKLAMWTL